MKISESEKEAVRGRWSTLYIEVLRSLRSAADFIELTKSKIMKNLSK
jgi:hypothetical protein